MYTQALLQIPDWVHEFRQWHVDMFAILTETQQARVHLRGNWIVFPYAEFDRLDPHFLVPQDSFLVPLPPNLRGLVSQISATVVDRLADLSDPREQLPGPSSSSARVTRSQTRGFSTGKSPFLTYSCNLF